MKEKQPPKDQLITTAVGLPALRDEPHRIPASVAHLLGAFSLGTYPGAVLPDLREVAGVTIETYLYRDDDGGRRNVRGAVQLRLDKDLPEERRRTIREMALKELTGTTLKVWGILLRIADKAHSRCFLLSVNEALDLLNTKRDSRGIHYSRNRRKLRERIRALGQIKFNVEWRIRESNREETVRRVRGPIIRADFDIDKHTVRPGEPVTDRSRPKEDFIVIEITPVIYDDLEVRGGLYTWHPLSLYHIDTSPSGHEIAEKLGWYFLDQFVRSLRAERGSVVRPMHQILDGIGLLDHYRQIRRKDRRRQFLREVEKEGKYLVQYDTSIVKSFGRVPNQPHRTNPLQVTYRAVIPDDHPLKRMRLLQECPIDEDDQTG